MTGFRMAYRPTRLTQFLDCLHLRPCAVLNSLLLAPVLPAWVQSQVVLGISLTM